ncbi:MAG: M23 family metallopeptidase [Sphingobium sp.]
MKRAGLLLIALLTGGASVSSPPSVSAASRQANFALQGPLTQGAAVLGTAPTGTVGLWLDDRPVALDVDRRFLIAFDRDAAPRARLRARMADGGSVEQMLTVGPRAWRIERIDAPLRPVKSSEAFMAIRRPELERIAAARATGSDARGWRQAFQWPRLGRISGLFGAQRIYRGAPGAYHSGIDIAGAVGNSVVAPADGVVTLAAQTPFSLEGNLLMIDHGNGLNSAFLHLSRIDVRLGQAVSRGQLVGAIGATGRATGPHLHWSVKWHDARIDPLLLTGPMPTLGQLSRFDNNHQALRVAGN